MEASPSRSDSFSQCWLRRKARAAAGSFERLGGEGGVGDGDLGHSFGSSVASFIDMDPAELFSMRWTSLPVAAAEDQEFDFGLPCDGALCSSPLLVGTGRVDFSDDGPLLPPCEPGVDVARDSTTTYADVSSPSPSSPLFHSALSTPASVIATSSRRAAAGGAAGNKARAPLLATRRILLRYLRFLVPLCRKVRSLPLRVLAPRSRAAASLAAPSTSPARRSTSSSYASAAEYWCHGNADTAVRDAILYCKKSIGQDM
ncbi:probable membrane-associated kinase regulator 6 [Oryza brachyantha]|uniref:probable membrane-associated kinase regulator 6 n=1 Tax=Oryza brachyantha TaxID=4533 RepID=UPI001AD9598C|nr:probable membrane-associated kinase regulator 6 [Oryza brachyantha]